MDYATTYNGAAAAAPKQKATTAAQKRSRVPAQPATPKRYRRGACRPIGVSPCGAAAYGFLKTRFLPHYAGQPATDGMEKANFYRSFEWLCEHYAIDTVDSTGFAYPYGRAVALHEAARLLHSKYPQHIALEVVADNGSLAVQATETYPTGNTLFYIPVLPLHQMMRRLRNTVHLDRFGEWLEAFTPRDTLDKECQAIAQKCYRLWQDYPATSLFAHADTDCLSDVEEDYDDYGCITMEKYIGFVATTKGWVYENVQQSVNSYFNESTSQQEPVLKRLFNGQVQETDTLDFECRLFPLLNELCYFLNNYDYDTERTTLPA